MSPRWAPWVRGSLAARFAGRVAGDWLRAAHRARWFRTGQAWPVVGPVGWPPARRGAFELGFLAVLVAVVLRGTLVGPVLGTALVATAGFLLARRLAAGDGALGLVLGGALAARLLTIGADSVLDLFPDPDVASYHFRAATLADSWWAGEAWRGSDNFKTALFEVAIAPAYALFGPLPVLGRTVNAVFGMLAAFNVYRIGATVAGRRAGLAGAAVFAFLPTILMTQTELLREALVVLLLTQAAWFAVRPTGPEALRVPLVLLALGPLVLLRPQTFLVAAGPLLLLGTAFAARPVLAALREARVRSRAEAAAAFTCVSALALAALLLLPGGIAEFTRFVGGPGGNSFAAWLDPVQLSNGRSSWVGGGSALGADVAFQDWWDVLAYLPYGAASFLLGPLPWQVHNAAAGLAFAENMLLYYPVALLALPGLVMARRDARALALLGVLLLAVVGYGLLEGNLGTALRHRHQFTWLVFVFAGPALAAALDALGTSREGQAMRPAPSAAEVAVRSGGGPRA